VYLPDLLVIHEPSKNTRISTNETTSYYIIGCSSVKLLLYPYAALPLMYLGFLLRFLKFFGLNIGEMIHCIKGVFHQTKGVKTKRISLGDYCRMVDEFGLGKVI
jgi:hypothetical protein